MYEMFICNTSSGHSKKKIVAWYETVPHLVLSGDNSQSIGICTMKIGGEV